MRTLWISGIMVLMLLPANLARAQYTHLIKPFSARALSKKLAGPPQTSADTPLTQKRPFRALLMSAVLPGLGQAYNKTYWRMGIYVGVEVASWFVYVDQTRLGRKLEDEFQQFADQYWSEDRYWAALSAESGIDINDMARLREWERQNFSHHLPEEKNQTYYENIGKYDQFNIGWVDARAHRARDSQLREQYTFMRKDSNDAFENARLGATIVILNHIISALEAALTAHLQDQRVRGSVRIVPKRVNRDIVPALALRVTW
ncbi:MAG: DUF5683 domain-containing protein [candidate division KSB1 bacterium]|nr:DUF5683 domain-containing protein [candidate division KSB1 bacterium]